MYVALCRSACLPASCRCHRAEELRAHAEDAQSKVREEAVQLRQQLLDTAGEAAENLTLATAELEASR